MLPEAEAIFRGDSAIRNELDGEIGNSSEFLGRDVWTQRRPRTFGKGRLVGTFDGQFLNSRCSQIFLVMTLPWHCIVSFFRG